MDRDTTHRAGRLWLAVLMGLVLCASGLWAQQAPRWTAAVRQDNDYMGLGGDDGDFTSGVRGEVLFHGVRGLGGLRRVLPFRPGCAPREDCPATIGVAAGQLIYTPENLTATRAIHSDRPYAGYLYGALVARRGDTTVLQSAELQVGVTGEASLAGTIQRFVHRIGQWRRPRGWDNQLGARLGINVSYDAQKVFASGRHADASLRGGFALGSIRTHVEVGGAVRFGTSLGAPWPEAGTRPAPRVGVHAYLAGNARYKLHDYFLDGPGSGPYPDKMAEVLDLEAGVALRLKCLEVGYRVVTRSPEYGSRRDWHRWGALTASVGVGCRQR